MTSATKLHKDYSTYAMLGGSLFLGLIVTIFGVFEPQIASQLSSDWFGLGIAFNNDCGRFDKPVLTNYGESFTVHQIGISCKDGSAVFQFKTRNIEVEQKDKIQWDVNNMPDTAVVYNACPAGTVFFKSEQFTGCLPH